MKYLNLNLTSRQIYKSIRYNHDIAEPCSLELFLSVVADRSGCGLLLAAEPCTSTCADLQMVLTVPHRDVVVVRLPLRQ